MIYYDVTKMRAARQKSGLTRVSYRLREELDGRIREVVWVPRHKTFCLVESGKPAPFRSDDWLLTVELFSEAERPGFRGFLKSRPCRLAAMFYDAIPLRHPHITWPQSVERHPDYMKLLAEFDRVVAISRDSARDLKEYWQWLGLPPRRQVSSVELGADLASSVSRATEPSRVRSGRPVLLSVGILEPRKNQAFLLGVAEALWRDGLDFELHLVGRVNPHFGAPVESAVKKLRKTEPRLHFHEAAGDAVLSGLYARARAVVFPSLAEGCGLPLLEALWQGVPCVCSDLPVLLENAEGGGCVAARPNDPADWQAKLRRIVTDEVFFRQLQEEALRRELPRWADTAAQLLQRLA